MLSSGPLAIIAIEQHFYPHQGFTLLGTGDIYFSSNGNLNMFVCILKWKIPLRFSDCHPVLP